MEELSKSFHLNGHTIRFLPQTQKLKCFFLMFCQVIFGVFSFKQKCPDGRYSLGAASVCDICPAGRSCMNGSDPIPPTECNPGTYSPPGVGICHACPLGTHSSTGASFCSPCPAGHTCNDPSESPVPCSSTEYWNNGGEVGRGVLFLSLSTKPI